MESGSNDGWQIYFDACGKEDLRAAFDAMEMVGVLPLVNVEDKHGKLKRPAAKKDEAWQKVGTAEWRQRLDRFIENDVPVGIGCKPVGYIVCDVDTLDRDTKRLPQAWKEAAQILFGSDDWPETLIVRTEGGAHVWFEVTAAILQAWDRSGKKAIALPSGDKVEIFVGLPDAGSQIACPPSAGKTIAMAKPPIRLPDSAEQAILDSINQPSKLATNTIGIEDDLSDFDWAKRALDNGYLDTQLADYDKWLAVGMALTHKFGDDGAELWEGWSARHDKHVGNECFVKVRSFKKTDQEKAIRFGSFVKIATDNGAAKPKKNKRHSIRGSLNGEPVLPPEDYTDLKFAEMAIGTFGDKFRYVEAWKTWATWDASSGTWVQSQCMHHEHFKHFATGEDEYLGSTAKIRAAASLAMSDPRIMAKPDQFDGHPDYINLKNGVLDLLSGNLLDHDPAFMATKQAAVVHDLSARCPKFMATLELTQPDPIIRLFLQRWLGTVLCGRTLAESVVNYGDGANGKSTILESVGLVMGTYFAKMPRGFIAKTKSDRHPAELVTLYGARFALASETDISDALDESKIKMILGDGSITARRMNENFWSFNPTHKFAIAANHMPTIVGQDSGIWRRLAFVPWLVTIPEDQRQPEFEKVLYSEESSGILNWLIEGYRMYLSEGLAIPERIKAAGKDIQESSDWLGEFFAECLTTDQKPGFAVTERIRSGQVYELYKKWALSNGVSVLASNKAIPLFSKRADHLGVAVKRLQNITWYVGLRIKEETDHQNEVDIEMDQDRPPF